MRAWLCDLLHFVTFHGVADSQLQLSFGVWYRVQAELLFLTRAPFLQPLKLLLLLPPSFPPPHHVRQHQHHQCFAPCQLLLHTNTLIQHTNTGTVVLHGKQLPWFVSDTLEHDLSHLIQTCSGSSGSNDGGAVAAVAARWKEHLIAGTWVFRCEVSDRVCCVCMALCVCVHEGFKKLLTGRCIGYMHPHSRPNPKATGNALA